MKEYVDGIYIKLKPNERELIKSRMKEAGIINMSAYIRKMAIDGYVIRLDLSELNEVTRLFRITSNNINQYARKANETGSIYMNDIKDIQEGQEKLCQLLKGIMQKLAKI
ncbi:MAG: plasmid mobilization relaxosome protein MobC [Butyrivibrio sp.]|nr:plasmid mobilization relaxosome protein MobC [uncultured Butyrivibrio sp.]MBE5845263.1 plasmid mobilization relaxosome protein MobC [Butyrivibrio sp.]